MPPFQLFLAGLFMFLSATLAEKSSGWGPRDWKGLVTFGDSYTDDSRFEYFESHNNTPPPVGWEPPINNNTYSGGYTWGHFASQAANLTRFNYAVNGASCSNNITPRKYPPMNVWFRSVLEYEIPAYIADSEYVDAAGYRFMDIEPDETVYSIWIGTNDLGNGAFLTDSQVNNATIPDYINCVYTVLDKVYDNGGRYFVIMNLAPLQLAPQYATPENGGVAATPGYPNKGPNITEISYRMWEAVATANEVYHYRTPFEAVIADRYPEAQLALMDMNGLISEIYRNPIEYLAAPANVMGFINHCDLRKIHCQRQPNAASYLWFDELHPSERTHETLAKEFVNVVHGYSRWAEYY
ncbi:GDSL lipase/esterase [Aspergillus crustosus]